MRRRLRTRTWLLWTSPFLRANRSARGPTDHPGCLDRRPPDRPGHRRRPAIPRPHRPDQGDVMAASGLPVLALIPRISRNGRKAALIASRNPALLRRAVLPASGTPAPDPSYLDQRPSDSRSPSCRRWNRRPSRRRCPRRRRNRVYRGRQSTLHTRAASIISGLGSAIAEAYCILQTNVAFSNEGGSVKTLVLTSALPGRERPPPRSISRSHSPSVASRSCWWTRHAPRTGTPASQPHPGARAVRGPPGCRDVRTGAPSRPGGESRELAVLTAGSQTASPPALVGSHRMAVLARATEGTYDLVLIDSPPINIPPTAALLGRQADGSCSSSGRA